MDVIDGFVCHQVFSDFFNGPDKRLLVGFVARKGFHEEGNPVLVRNKGYDELFEVRSMILRMSVNDLNQPGVETRVVVTGNIDRRRIVVEPVCPGPGCGQHLKRYPGEQPGRPICRYCVQTLPRLVPEIAVCNSVPADGFRVNRKTLFFRGTMEVQ